MPQRPADSRKILLAVVAGLVVWGGYLAIGAAISHKSFIPGLIVGGCFALFLGFWLGMIALRKRRLKRERETRTG